MSDVARLTFMPEIYHALSRGVDKRPIFMDDKDRYRFIHDLFEFNDEARAFNHSYFCQRNLSQSDSSLSDSDTVISLSDREIAFARPPRKLLVNVLAFCLMPNHYHLLLQPLVKNGVSLFMKKLNGGYVQYFNKKHERTGTLFERKYKSVLVDSQSHFIHMPYYIHLNALDLVAPEWRQRKIEDLKRALDFLAAYRWSSHLDYCGEENFPSVTQRDFLFEIFEGEKGYKKKMDEWLKEIGAKRVGDFALE